MKKYGPEAEKEQFVQEYKEALSLTPQLTIGHIKELVVEVMDGTFDEVQPAEIMQPIVGFIKKTLKNSDIPFNWLTGDILEEVFKEQALKGLIECMPNEKVFERLFFLNKIDWTVENRERLPIEKENNKEMIQDLIMSFYLSELPGEYLKGEIPTINKISHIDVELIESKGRITCTITVKYENGHRFAGGSDVTRTLELAGYIT